MSEIPDAAVEAAIKAGGMEGWDYIDLRMRDALTAALPHLAAGRAEAVAAGWQTMETAPEVGSKFIALYNDGSGGVLFFRHDGGYIDHDGEDWSIVDSSQYERWTYLPAGFEFWCEGAPEPVELPEWKGPGSALVSAPAAPSDGLGQFKPSVTVNEEAGLTEATFEDVPFVAQPVLPGVHHWIDKHVAMDDGRLVGIAIWATKLPAAPAAPIEPMATWKLVNELCVRLKAASEYVTDADDSVEIAAAIQAAHEFLDASLAAPSPSQEALREALDLDKAVSTAALTWCGEKDRETFQSDVDYFKHNWRALPGLTAYVDRELGKRARAALAQSAPVKGGE